MNVDSSLFSDSTLRMLVWDIDKLLHDNVSLQLSPLTTSQVPEPEELAQHASAGELFIIAAPAPQNVLDTLILLDLFPKEAAYVVGFVKYPPTFDFTELIPSIPDELLLVGYDGANVSGKYADLFEFTEEPGKRNTTFTGELDEDTRYLLKLMDAEACLGSVMRGMRGAFGGAKLARPTCSEKRRLAQFLSNGADIDFLPDDFPQWKRECLDCLADITEPALADEANRTKETLEERESRVPELVRYRPIWQWVFKCEWTRRAPEGRPAGMMTVGMALELLPGIARHYGVDYMMGAVDAGVPVEYVVSEAAASRS